MKYYAMVDDRQVGPYTLDELMEAGIGPDTYVWCKGMADWERADDNADICRYYRQRLSRLQHPQPATPVTPAAGEAEPQEEGMVYPDLSELPDLAAHDPTVPPPPGLMAAAIAVTVLCFPLPASQPFITPGKPRKNGRSQEDESRPRPSDMPRCGQASL